MYGGELDAQKARIEQFHSGDDGTEDELQGLLVQNRQGERWSHERLVAALPAPVVVTDAHGVIQMANESAGALLHMRVDRLLREPLLAFVSAAQRDDLRRLLAEAVQANRDFRSVATLVPRQGEPVSVHLAATVRGAPATGAREVTWALLDGPVLEPDAAEATPGGHLARALVELTQLPFATSETPEVLTRMAEACQRAFSRPVAVSIDIGHPGRPDVVATGSKLAQSVSGAQMIAGEGPAQTAWGDRSTVCCGDIRTDRRWPRLPGRLGASPVRSVVAVPLGSGETVTGVLAFYSEGDHLAEDAAVESAELLGRAVAAVLREGDARSELQESANQLQAALVSRATIDQAKGMIMASRGCGPDEAFQILTSMSSTANVKLREIAARMVEEASQGNQVLRDRGHEDGADPVEQ